MGLPLSEIPNVLNFCTQIEGLLKMKAPLMKLWEERAFEKWVHDRIPTAEQFTTLQKFVEPLGHITKSINKLRETDRPTIQHALPIIYQLCNLDELEASKLAQYNNNFLYHVTVIYICSNTA